MKPLAVLLQLVSFILPSARSGQPPDVVVRDLYQQIVARRPLGVPTGEEKAALSPFLSKALIQKLDVAQSCEDDYLRQYPDTNLKPEFGWLETNLFSGTNELASPSAATVERTEPMKDGTFRVYVRLTYKDSFETYGKPPDPIQTFNWQVAAVVISEAGRYVVNDVLFFEDDSTRIASRLTDSFAGCDGPRWVGINESQSAPTKIGFENTSMGELRDEDGVHLGFTNFRASDGNTVTVLYEDFGSPATAEAFLEKQIAKAATVVERKDKLGPDGRVVGERAEITLGLSAEKAVPAVLWTDGVKFHEIYSTSRDSVLELERVYRY
jgi:hypothetical protein